MWKALAHPGHHFEEPKSYRVLRIVRDAKSISRTEIAQQSRLSQPTGSDIVQRFLQAGFLEIAGESGSTTWGSRRVVGVDVRMKESQVAVTDLNANILGREESTCGAGSSPDVVLVADTLTSWEGVHIRDHFGETLRPTDQKGVVGA